MGGFLGREGPGEVHSSRAPTQGHPRVQGVPGQPGHSSLSIHPVSSTTWVREGLSASCINSVQEMGMGQGQGAGQLLPIPTERGLCVLSEAQQAQALCAHRQKEACRGTDPAHVLSAVGADS